MPGSPAVAYRSGVFYGRHKSQSESRNKNSLQKADPKAAPEAQILPASAKLGNKFEEFSDRG